MDYYNNSYGGYMQQQTPAYNNYSLKLGLQYATFKELEALIIPPGTQVMALAKDQDALYVKIMDNLGRSTMKVYELTEKGIDNTTQTTKNADFLVKSDLVDINTKLAELERKINDLQKFEVKDGRIE